MGSFLRVRQTGDGNRGRRRTGGRVGSGWRDGLVGRLGGNLSLLMWKIGSFSYGV